MYQQNDYLFENKEYLKPEIFPLHIDLELNASCNKRCIMCPFSEKEKNFKEGKMKVDHALKILEYCSKNGTKTIKPHFRGEPTIYLYLEKVLKKAKKYRLITMMNTNGSFPLENTATLAEYLDWVSISMDEYHNNMDWQTFYKSVIFSKYSIYTEIQTVKPDEWLERLCNEYKINLKVDSLKKRTEGCNYEVLDLSKKKRKPCNFVNWRMVITHDLKVKPCCVPWGDKELIMGNIDIDNLDSIKEIWRSENYKNLREDQKTLAYGYEECKKCTSSSAYV